MTWTLTLLLTFAGFAALALSQPKHHATALGGPVPPRRRTALRVVGWLGVAAATVACVRGFGWDYGLVALAAAANLAGAVLALLLAYPERWSRRTRHAA